MYCSFSIKWYIFKTWNTVFDPSMARKMRALRDWKNANKRYIGNSSDARVSQVIDAASTGEILEITYFGGSQPGASRQISPRAVFISDNYRHYVEAYDYRRKTFRTFRLDRMQVLGTQASTPSSRNNPKPHQPRATRPVTVTPETPESQDGKGGLPLGWLWVVGIILILIIFS